jgi:hypothetical protein
MPDESLPMSMPLKLAIAAYIAIMNVGLTITLARIWPDSSGAAASTESHYLFAAAIAGALGSCIHLTTSFVNYAGIRELRQSWGWWYLLRPGIGAALAVVVYFVIRAGLITGAGAASTGSINPYGVASLSALSGMFSKQATEKLQEVFENICKTTPASNTP